MNAPQVMLELSQDDLEWDGDEADLNDEPTLVSKAPDLLARSAFATRIENLGTEAPRCAYMENVIDDDDDPTLVKPFSDADLFGPTLFVDVREFHCFPVATSRVRR